MRYALLFASLLLPTGCFLEREPLLPPSGGPDGGRADSGPGGDAGQPDACAPAEICNNGTDDDCDGMTDEGCECTPGATQPCDGACGATQTCGPDSRWGACTGGTPPTQYYADADGDGYGDPGTSMGFCDPPGSGWVLDATDCDDACEACHPGGTETCDVGDEDCDTLFDEGVGDTYYPDMDGDGFGARAGGITSCAPPGDGFVMNDEDCDDDCALCRPDFPDELCRDGRDNDCDGTTDESGCPCDLHRVTGAIRGEYLFCRTDESWDAGRTRCRSYGGDLASIETQAENEAIWAFVDPYNMRVWAGGYDRGPMMEGTWVWVSGASIGTCAGGACSFCSMWCNWASGQPSTGSGAGQDCLALDSSDGGRWEDQECGDTEAVLCEL